jgi:hypothetical protein
MCRIIALVLAMSAGQAAPALAQVGPRWHGNFSESGSPRCLGIEESASHHDVRDERQQAFQCWVESEPQSGGCGNAAAQFGDQADRMPTERA